MMIASALTTVALACSAMAGLKASRSLRRRGLNHCLLPLLRDSLRPPRRRPVHVLLCIADHYEPLWSNPCEMVARHRVQRWTECYPRLFSAFRDSDGRSPRHSFFFPIDQYRSDHVESVAGLCREGFGEVEIHLHHDHDTPENLRTTLSAFTSLFARKHGLLGRGPDGGIAYGFIHGNWSLDNARADGRWCGVNNELDILRETGCYADFTLPSAPSQTQTRTINSLYYVVDDPCRGKSHDTGTRVGTALRPPSSLMMIQGPLLLDWRRRKLENACLQQSQLPTMSRLDRWVNARIGVPQRPDWVFVKLHTHGAPEANQRVLLGEPMVTFHRDLARRAQADENFHYHYVTAREMYNLARAAEAGFDGEVRDALDYEVVSNLQVNRSRAAA